MNKIFGRSRDLQENREKKWDNFSGKTHGQNIHEHEQTVMRRTIHRKRTSNKRNLY